ncbi:Matrixin [Pseudobythopirellula maris]|uniref:Matrixin n=1 Tax=Pseudobythopirellula maris TaxID=2527991 RepID=A0A5C5ZNA6_9BACT|nr:matrixin family metalloprotease [Pseudobythopirellula maris]TWT88660.1 Matrixin [Pseudobythopirellula maris]
MRFPFLLLAGVALSIGALTWGVRHSAPECCPTNCAQREAPIACSEAAHGACVARLDGGGYSCTMYAPGYVPPRSHNNTFVVQNPEWKWPQVAPGTPITLTYSYSNLLDGEFSDSMSESQIRAAVEEALGLWAEQTVVTFQEVDDRGPPVRQFDRSYFAWRRPNLRFGHHPIDTPGATLAHAYFPYSARDGLAGDLHFDSADSWVLGDDPSGFDFLEVCVHEIGHALGLGHEPSPPGGVQAVMNPFYAGRYNGLGSAFLLPDDVDGIRTIYGEDILLQAIFGAPADDVLAAAEVFGYRPSPRALRPLSGVVRGR